MTALKKPEISQSDEESEFSHSDAEFEVSHSDAENGVSHSDDESEVSHSDAENEVSHSDAENEVSHSDDESEVSEGAHDADEEAGLSSDGGESDGEAGSSDRDFLSQDSAAEEDDTSSAQESEQAALKAVMSSLLSKNKTEKEILSKASKNVDGLTGENKRKRIKPLEILQEDGTIIKVKQQQADLPGRKDPPQLTRKRKLDLLFSDACTKTDVVKEKKLRSLATKGVVQLFNTLEQHRQQQQQRTPASHSQKKSSAPINEMTAITSGNSNLINFLATKTMGGDRQLFSEVKEEEDGQG